MPFPLVPVIAAGASLLGNAINAGSQNKTNRENRRFQQEENQKARDFNLDMWNRNNEYNDPTNQMARLKEAGINPHLAYSNGSPMNTSNAPASSNASNMPEGRAPQVDVNTMLMALRTKAEIDNINADTKQKQTSTEGQNLINGMSAIQLANEAEKVSLTLKGMRTQINVGNSNIRLNEQNINQSIQTVTNMITQNSKMKLEFENIIEQKNLTIAQTSQVLALLGVAHAQAEMYRSQAKLNSEKAKTESNVRSNLNSNTLKNNEIIKSLERGNQIGDTYDFNKAENDFQLDNQKIYQIKQVINNLMKDGQLKDIGIDQAGLNLLLDKITFGGDAIKSYISPVK